MKNYLILGGGIAGLTTAIALKRLGIRATVCEAAPAFRPVGAGLLLAANAIQAYRKLDIAEKIIARGRLLPRFSILDQRGRTLSTIDAAKIGKLHGIHNFAIHRAELHEALLAELEPEQLLSDKRAIGVSDTGSRSLRVEFADGSFRNADYLIVADGIHSAIRRQLLPEAEERYSGYTCWRAIIDAGDIDQTEATETWGPSGRFGIVPLPQNRIYWFACINAMKNDPVMQQFRVTDLQRHFAGFHAPIDAVLDRSSDTDLIWNDIIDLKPISRFAFGRIVLMGDAAHATTPNMGQGACQAIEDAVVLADELSRRPEDPAAAFSAFEQRRLARTRFIVDNSWTLGRVAQISRPWLAGLRNIVFRMIPESVNERQMKKVLGVDF